MRRPAAIGVVIALFLVGVVVGALGANLVLRRHLLRPSGGGPGGPGGRMSGAAAELQRRLDLTPDQRRQVEAILADSHRESAALWSDLRPRLVAIVERASDRIDQILAPQQRVEFQRYRSERRDHLHGLLRGLGPPSRRRGGPGGAGGPGAPGAPDGGTGDRSPH